MSTQSVALVTGATSGIGAATAKAYAAKGYAVVVSGRREDRGQAVVDDIIANGGTAHFIQADVSDEAQATALVAATVEKYGRLDTAFNNAGIEGDLWTPLHETTRENYDNVFNINVWGIVATMKAEITYMSQNGGGSIVNNASVAGLNGFGGMSVYTASKHAVVGFTKNGALEYAQAGIRVNAVAPGPVQTDMYDRFATGELKEQINAMVPMGRPGTPEEIASAVLWLSDPANSYTTGQTVAIDGGYVTQ